MYLKLSAHESFKETLTEEVDTTRQMLAGEKSKVHAA